MSETRWIVLNDGTPSSSYIGTTNLDPNEITDIMNKGGGISLKDARRLQVMVIPEQDRSGVTRIRYSVSIVPIDFNRAGIDLYIKPTIYYEAATDSDGFKTLIGELDEAERAEINHRAKDAGLITPNMKIKMT